MDDDLDLEQLCWKLAGVCGVGAWNYSLRQLTWMSEGRLREEWNQTTALMSWVGRVGPWVDPNKLNPFHEQPEMTPEREASESRQAFALLGRALADMQSMG